MQRNRAGLASGLVMTLAVSAPAAAKAQPRLLASELAIVASVDPGSGAAAAGIRAGDRILEHGGIERPRFDQVLLQEFAEARARDTRLGMERAGERHDFEIRAGDRGWSLTPDWTDAGRQAFERLRTQARSGNEVELRQDLDQALERLERESATAAAGWLLWSIAQEVQSGGRGEEAMRLLEEASRRAQTAGSPYLRLRALLDLASAAGKRGEIEDGADRYEEARKLAARVSALAEAQVLNSSSVSERQWGRLDRAEELGRRALELRQAEAPESPAVADILNNLGNVAWARGDLDLAQTLHLRSMELERRAGPKSLGLAKSLNNLAVLAFERGDLAAAREHLTRSLSIKETLAPSSLSVAASLSNLGAIATSQGDLASARRYHFQAFELRERLEPQSLLVANSQDSLGQVAWAQGDLDAAWEYEQRALELRERLAPDSPDVAGSLNNLAGVALDRAEVDKALELGRRALQLKERISPESLPVARSLMSLAAMLREQGSTEPARRELERALGLLRRLAPGGLDEANVLVLLAEADLDAGDLVLARERLERARSTQQRLAPGSQALAQTLWDLGRVAWKEQGPAAAEPLLREAVGAVEAQRQIVGEARARLHFAGRAARYYHELVLVRLELGQVESALETIERSRARTLIEILGQRSIDWTRSVPQELHSRQLRLRRKREQLARSLNEASETTPSEQVEAWRSELSLLDTEEDALALEIRGAVPEYSELVHPAPLRFAQIRQALEPGTALLAYSIGEERSAAIAMLRRQDGSSELASRVLELRWEDLAIRLDALRGVIGRCASGPCDASWASGAAALYRDLLAPFEQEISEAQRVLIVPDGPMHLLPFAVLGPDADAANALGVRRPISVISSITLFEQLRQRAAPERFELAWAGLGDPEVPEPETPARGDEYSVRSRLPLGPLPGARDELGRIRDRLDGPARLLLGAEASERGVRDLPGSIAVLHFAGHAFLDARFPMSSGLVLSGPRPGAAGSGSEDGVLEAWEVMQDLRLDSQLVVLSACDAGGGRLMGGEGLVGLTRAFLFAGARSLVVSLWAVSDVAAGRFMDSFYGALLQGGSKDQALCRARREAIRDPRMAHPYFWSGFELVGDPGPVALRGRGTAGWRLALGGALALAGLATALLALRRGSWE
jgi:CHAT domain-containing protein/Tfp pilus assembly protein PilF